MCVVVVLVWGRVGSWLLVVVVFSSARIACRAGRCDGLGGEVHGAEPVEDDCERRSPGPPGGEVEGVAAGGVGESAGSSDEGASDGVAGDRPGVGGADADGPAGQVVGEDGEAEPGCVGVESAGWAVGEAVGFEVADGELDDGVSAVMLVFVSDRAGAVRDEGVMIPVREQRFLFLVEDHGPAHDETPVLSSDPYPSQV